MTDTAARRIAAAERTAEAGTPGPWETHGARHLWSPNAKSNVATVGEPRGERKTVGYEELDIGSPDASEAYGNAKKIAAAVNLLAAGIAAIKAVLRGREPHPFEGGALCAVRINGEFCGLHADDPIHSPEVAAYVASLPGVTDACANCDHPDHAGWMCTALAGKDGVCTCKQAAAETLTTGENE